MASKLQLGLQQGYLFSAAVTAGNLLAMIFVWLGLQLGWSIPALVFGLYGAPAIVQVANTFIYVFVLHPQYRPRVSDIQWPRMHALMRTGGMFFLIQFFGILTFRVDAIILAQFFGPAVSGVYSVVDRAFSMVSILSIAFLTPLWPAYREAIHRGDGSWVSRTLVRSMAASVAITGVVALALVAFQKPIFRLWVGPQLHVPGALVIGFAAWKIVETAGTAGAMFMNGAGALRQALLMVGGMGLVATALKFALVPTLGYISIVWITGAVYALFCVVPLAFIAPVILRRISVTSARLAGVASAET